MNVARMYVARMYVARMYVARIKFVGEDLAKPTMAKKNAHHYG